MMLASFGMMIGAGSSTIIANKLGEKNNSVVNRYFSMFVYFLIIGGIILSVIEIFVTKPILIILGAEDYLLDVATYYGLMSLFSMPVYILQTVFLSFFITAGQPKMCLITAIISVVTIFVIDLILVAFLHMGIEGIIIATITTEYVSAIIPICYFARKKP